MCCMRGGQAAKVQWAYAVRWLRRESEAFPGSICAGCICFMREQRQARVDSKKNGSRPSVQSDKQGGVAAVCTSMD